MATITAAAAPIRRRLSTFQQAMLSLYWFAVAVHWGAILNLLLPKQAEDMGGAEFKANTLGLILGLGAFVSMIAAPLFGALSDRVSSRWGRRRPWLVIGTLANAVGLIVLAYLPTTPSAIVPYIVVFMAIEVFNNVATAPYSALIPDMVAPEQRGSASGWQGLMNVLGGGVGIAFGLWLNDLGIRGTYWALAAILIVGMLGTVFFIHEPPHVAEAQPFRWGEFLRGLLTPFRSRDFTWVFLTRLLVLGGTLMIQVNVLYYMTDVIRNFSFFGTVMTTKPEEATTMFFLPLLLGGVIGAYGGGVLSDRLGRKTMVYASGALQAAVAVALILTHSFTLVVLLGVVFGLGYGAYQSVDWALATDVLPSDVDYAKDMGVWHVTNTLPQFTAIPLGNFILTTFQQLDKNGGNPQPQLGYTLMFGLAIVLFILGTVLVRQVRGVR